MEIKIKDKDQLIGATIEVVNGVMIVSPKEEKYEPKDGDVVIIDSFHPCIGIVRDTYSYGKLDTDRLYFSVGYWIESESVELKPFCACNRNTHPNYRPATEEEKQKLFDKLAEEGLEWKPDTKELVKIKWKPKVGDTYFRPDFNKCRFLCYVGVARYDTMRYIKAHIDKGWCFKSEQECQEFCNRLNEAINSVKP